MAGLLLASRMNGSPSTVPSSDVHVAPPSVDACTYSSPSGVVEVFA
jgi:hypothetical protein